MSKSPTLFSDDEDEEPHQQEELLLKKLHSFLQGVPPPSSITMSKLSASDMLEKYNENRDSYTPDVLNTSQRSLKKYNSTPLVYYLNSSKTSEEVANISQKVISRYVHSETMSSCNIWFDSYTVTSSVKKNMSRRNRLGFSPGSRLSHLARRRQIFSSENLQKLANSERRRQIEIEKQNTSKNRSILRSRAVGVEQNSSFKRALFMSPENEDSTKKNVLISSSQHNLPLQSNKNIVKEGNKSFCFSQGNTISSSKKRKRLESRDGNESWPRRALTFTDKDMCKSDENNSKNAKIISDIQFSLHHKSKLLWAVSVTLKEKDMHSNDPQFKTCASTLFMICRRNLNSILNSKVEGGTSDKILHFARGHVDEILQRVGVSTELKTQNEKDENVCKSTGNSNIGSEINKKNTVIGSEDRSICLDNNDISSYSIASEDLNTTISEKENIDTGENIPKFEL